MGIKVQGFKVLGSGFWVQGFGFKALDSEFWVLGSLFRLSGYTGAQPPTIKDRSNRKRNSEKANIEYRIMNNECRSKVFYHFKL